MHASTAAIYDGVARRWQESRGEANDELGRCFREQAGNGLVVDLGCGPGRYLSQIAGPVVALDASRSMLAMAGGHGYPVLQADLVSVERIPRQGDEADLLATARR